MAISIDKNKLNEWEPVIGLEIHVQLSTKSKLFSGASTNFGADPNTQACNIDLGLPGVLPVLNKEVLKMAVKFGLAINASINSPTSFARKNYFYPDLPKGYQISQLDNPIVEGGSIDVSISNGESKTIGITRAHLEEDAGKSLHEDYEGMTGVDLNRAGTPLLEIVSEPDLRSANEAVSYLKKIHSIVRYLEISDGNMAEGSMRCDANVSVRKKGETTLGTRTEIKNVNSFRFVEKAINYEIKRQVDLLLKGEEITQDTILYDSIKDETRPMRSKEFANDYRYFPEPDLLPVILESNFIEEVKQNLPELLEEKKIRFMNEFELSDYDADVLVADKGMASYYENVVQLTKEPKLSANWVMGDLSAFLNKENLDIVDTRVSHENLAKLIQRISDNTISGKIAKEIFEIMWDDNNDPDAIIEERGLKQVTDSSEIESLVDKILEDNPNQLSQFRSGKEKLFGFFVGQVMKASGGKANPSQVNEILKSKLNNN
ncbi:MAG: Asp-tRNA(Asn)/Glu-tRNA(Gln) amidotransferase subunit GatB [Pseudomonadota bacterium]|nr:Asp-tRNA(Asn)/Glu-tRNA(Gln) amidotransferase subunit GatB [Pseudomonadota bacterium]|tara:strand:- start:454 stop:1920 length:1467 start_codon:yes stop_codon:yes gene_type:complete